MKDSKLLTDIITISYDIVIISVVSKNSFIFSYFDVLISFCIKKTSCMDVEDVLGIFSLIPFQSLINIVFV